MAKILLVEDDNNLREIYEARLQAEGYDIVSAKDGEEALVVAKKQRPDLIIADVMMPRVSGFEMLDIIRNTPELKDVHVIMLTALGQAEDKTRADSLGADRYLVKSQVTLEDIVKAAGDVLAGAPANSPAVAAAAASADAAQPTPPAQDATVPQVTTIPVSAPPTATTPVAPAPDLSAPQTPSAPSVAIPVSTPPVATPAPQPQAAVPATSPQDTVPAAPEPSTTDSQLVTNAVNDLVAGAPAVPAAPAPDAMPPSQIAPATPVASTPVPPVATPAPQPQPPLTMQPVLTPPVVQPQPQSPVLPPTQDPVPPTQQAADGPMIGSSAATTRKAIVPLPASETPDKLDLNQLLAKEGHSMDDTPGTPEFGNVPHMPGNVIAPGAPDATPPQAPASQNPTDPNSISL